MPETVTLICPKCRGEMRSYERNGVLVDQCSECRGIFLDRGELERLLDSEPPARHDDHERMDRSHDGEHRDERGKKRRASSLLEQLLGGE